MKKLYLERFNIEGLHLGRFKVSGDFLEENYNDVIDIFAQLKIVPLYAEYSRLRDEIEYVALSPAFDKVKGNNIPEYIIYKRNFLAIPEKIKE